MVLHVLIRLPVQIVAVSEIGIQEVGTEDELPLFGLKVQGLNNVVKYFFFL